MHPYGLYRNKNDKKFGQRTLAKFSREGKEPDILRRPRGSYGRSSTRGGLFGLNAVAKHSTELSFQFTSLAAAHGSLSIHFAL